MFVPWHVGEKRLQALLAGTRDRLGHGVTGLTEHFREQFRQGALQSGLALLASETDLESRQKFVQLEQCRGTGMNI